MPQPRRRPGPTLLLATLALAASAVTEAQPGAGAPPLPEGVTRIGDIAFASAGGRELGLDLYLPETDSAAPLIVFVHGGAWMRGSRADVPTFAFVEAGYALASVEYRLSPEAPFPAQIHDIKAAVRFLRANASRYGYDARRIGIFGVSAGAHLAALVAVTNGHAELEGRLGDHPDESSAVQAVVSYFGASNFETILAQSTPRGLGVRVPALENLLGGTPDAKPELAALASPVEHVDAGDPPLLLLHGDQDPQMPINQSHELNGAYKAAGLETAFHVVHGAGHGGPEFFDAERLELALGFLDAQLRTAD